MRDRAESAPLIRTAVAADLPALQRMFRAAALSNADDAAMLLARPELLVFTGEGINEGRTRVAAAGPQGQGRILGFVTVSVDQDGEAQIEDLFVDPGWRRRGVARRLVLDAARTAREVGRRRLSVIANPHASAFYRAVGFVDTERAVTGPEAGPRLDLDLDQT